MYIKAPKERFVSMLNLIQNAVSTKTTMQMLSNFYIGVKGSMVHLIATDLEIFIEGKFNFSSVAEKEKIELKDGECTIPAKRFMDMIKEQEAGMMIEVKVGDGYRVDVKCGRAHFNLPGFSSKDYPEALEFPKQKTVSISAAVLKEMIEKTIFSVSSEDVRYALTGVFFEVEKNVMKLVSTDSRRLAFISSELDGAKFSHSAIVPPKALNELLRSIDLLQASEVRIGFADNQISFGVGDVVISSRLIDGEFPNYERVIPKEQPLSVNMKAKEFLTALKQLQFLAQDKSSVVKFSLKKDLVTILASVQGVGQGEVELDVKYGDKPIEIIFNANFLMDYLRAVKDSEIKLELATAVSPVVFSLASGESMPNVKKYLYIVMPIRTE